MPYPGAVGDRKRPDLRGHAGQSHQLMWPGKGGADESAVRNRRLHDQTGSPACRESRWPDGHGNRLDSFLGEKSSKSAKKKHDGVALDW